MQRNGQRRVLRISLLPFFASEMFIPRLSAFADRHRAIDIRVETTEAGALQPSASDASILLLSSRPPRTCARIRCSLCASRRPARRSLRASSSSAIRARLIGATLIVHKARPHAWQDWFASMSIALDRPPKVIQLDSMFAVARAAERGLGVALVPVALSGTWFNWGALVRPCIGELETTERYYFVYRAEAAQKPGRVRVARLGDRDVRAEQDEAMSAVA